MSGLTANSSIDQWLTHPVGGDLLRGVLAQGGVGDEGTLAPVRGLPLQQLVALSQGKLPQEVLDALVLAANDGVAPTSDAVSTVWAEKITPGRFTGQTVIVTGAASGIGRATASRVAREGGRVIATDIAADKLAEFATSVPGADIVAIPGDITDQATIEEIVTAAGGQIDALANVVGINDDFSPLHETTDEMWDRVMAINVTGPFKLARAVIPGMLEAGKGAIVNVASEAALRGNASGNAYTASKHAVIGLTKSAAFMYGQDGLRINVLAPGGVSTGIPFPATVSAAGRAKLDPFLAMIPGIATAEEIAASLTFLLSDDAVNINGAVFTSDGGWSVQ